MMKYGTIFGSHNGYQLDIFNLETFKCSFNIQTCFIFIFVGESIRIIEGQSESSVVELYGPSQ